VLEDAVKGVPVVLARGLIFPTGKIRPVERLLIAGFLYALFVRGGIQLVDVDVAEGNLVAVAKESDLAGAALHALMIRVFFGKLIEVRVQDRLAVEGDLDDGVEHDDALVVPLPGRLEALLFCGMQGVNGAMVLVVIEVFPLVRVVVENLEFHAGVGAIAKAGIMDAEAVVASGLQFEIEIEDVGGEGGLGDEVFAVRCADDAAVLDDVSLSLPAGEILAVEERSEFFPFQCGGECAEGEESDGYGCFHGG